MENDNSPVPNNFSAAYDKALRLLSLRAHSKKELENKLRQKFSPEASREAVERCENAGFINDEKFAESYAEELLRRKGFSGKRIFSALLQKGISRETAESAVNALDIDENSGIIKALKKMHITEESNEKEIARAVRRLLNMGYNINDIKKYIGRWEEY